MAMVTTALVGGSGAAAAPRRHFYFVPDSDSLASLQQHRSRVDLASPAWFEVNAAGELASHLDPSVVAWARAQHLPLMPLLVNTGFDPAVAKAILAAPDVQARLAGQLAQQGRAHGLYGVQLDFEEVAAEDRAALTRFVAQLAGTLKRAGLRTSVAVPAPLLPSADAASGFVPNPRAAAFDLGALARAAEFLTLMAYDQHTAAADAGPVAGAPWVEACIRSALLTAPAKKLMLGLPLYHRRWTGREVVAGPWSEASALAAEHGVAAVVDPVEREKTFSFGEGDGRTIAWFHDATTLRERVALAQRHKLAGVSAWRLGQEDPGAWEAVFASGRH